MGFNFNNNQITAVNYNGNPVTTVTLDGVTVWTSGPEITEFWIRPYNEAYVGFSIGGSWSDPETSKAISYSFDRSNWTDTNVTTLYNSGSPDNFIHVNAGQKIYWKSDNATSLGGGEWARYVFSVLNSSKSAESEYDIGGEYNSLYNYELGPSSRRYTSCRVFWNSQVVDASECILPYSPYVTERLFEGCSHLVYAPAIEKPEVPGTIPCLDETFLGCSSLVTIPEIVGYGSTNLDYRTFWNCSSLKFSEVPTQDCPNAYCIPEGAWTGTAGTTINQGFGGTGGTFTGSIEFGKVYYTNATIVPSFEYPETPEKYFYIKCLVAGNSPAISLVAGGNAYYPTLLCSIDKTTWTSFGTTPVSMNEGDKLYIKAGPNGNDGINHDLDTSTYNYFNLENGQFTIGGDITTLIDEDGVDDLSQAGTGQFHFARIFNGQTNLVGCSKLRLPQIIGYGSFHYTFQNSYIDTIPDFTAVRSVGYNAFGSAFRSCQNIGVIDLSMITTWLSSPEQYHYGLNHSFNGCSHLHTAKIPTAEPSLKSYNGTFYSDSQLQLIYCPWTTWGDNSNTNWMYNVGGTGIFYCPSALGDESTIARGNDNCPSNFTVINVSQ